MIVYNKTKENFINDVISGTIGSEIEKKFLDNGLPKSQHAEYNSWINSLPRMSLILQDSRIDNNCEVAIEFQIPLTSKRVDFMISGNNEDKDHIVVIELKQWETCKVTDKEYVVNAFTGGANRDVAHPSQQAYSYAKLIEDFNESVYENNIELNPCAYLHNYKDENKDQILHSSYNDIVKLAPVFLMKDSLKLRDFICKYISKPANKNLFELIDYGKLKPSKSLQDVAGSMLNGNEEFRMIDEQLVAFSTILKLVQNSIGKDEKHTIIVQGGPGTGKSVIAINVLAKCLNSGYAAVYVTKNSAPRKAFAHKLVKGKHTITHLKGLFKSSGSFYDKPSNLFDCILVDEAHRLNEKSGMYKNVGENQIKEIINSAKISVFFIDEDKRVSTSDIGSINEIFKWANHYNSKIHFGESLILTSQFRCNGSDSYLAFLDDVLEIRKTANYNYFDIDYDIRIFDSPSKMRELLKEKNINNKARMIAGYCYHWESKNDKTKYDIFLEDGFKAQWNFTTDSFAYDEDSFEQVGCIHSTQGLEFDYVGIIIGKDMRYENGKVVTDKTKRDKNDTTIQGVKDDFLLADRIIKNTYRTLLSRGQKGCYIYCEDKPLANYLKDRLSKVNKN